MCCMSSSPRKARLARRPHWSDCVRFGLTLPFLAVIAFAQVPIVPPAVSDGQGVRVVGSSPAQVRGGASVVGQGGIEFSPRWQGKGEG
jgi:hypothetical protein